MSDRSEQPADAGANQAQDPERAAAEQLFLGTIVSVAEERYQDPRIPTLEQDPRAPSPEDGYAGLDTPREPFQGTVQRQEDRKKPPIEPGQYHSPVAEDGAADASTQPARHYVSFPPEIVAQLSRVPGTKIIGFQAGYADQEITGPNGTPSTMRNAYVSSILLAEDGQGSASTTTANISVTTINGEPVGTTGSLTLNYGYTMPITDPAALTGYLNVAADLAATARSLAIAES